MSTTLLLRLRDSDGPVSWAVCDDIRRVVIANGTLPADASALPDVARAAGRVWVIVPGSEVYCRPVAIPPQAERRARNAAAFLLEDDLAVDPEELHFALGPAIGDEPRLVAAVSHRLMSHWRSWLAQFGVTTEVMVPDFLALPIPSAIADGDVALVRTATTAFTIERDMLPAMTDVQDAVPQELAPESLIALFHRTLLMAPCLNLLQGPYAPVRSWGLPSAWRRAAILAGVAVGLAAAGQIAVGWRLNAEAEAASARAEAVLRAAMPEVKRVVNPRAQIRAHLQEMRAGSSNTFLRLCQLTFPAVQKVEGAEIQALRYDGRRSELAATVALPSFEAIERIKTELAGKGLLLQEGGARQDGTRILAELIVKLS